MKKSVGRKMTEIAEMLGDRRWHTVGEISRRVSQPVPKVRLMLKLMVGLGEVEYARGKARLTQKGLEWLREESGNLR